MTAPLSTANYTEILPGEFQLLQNYPNPFNPLTTIEFYLPVVQEVELAVFNILGQRVRTLIGGIKMSSGFHAVHWNGNTDNGVSLPSGMYISVLTVAGKVKTRKLILLR
jgi:flagellar hook assembly protein FlgD